MGRDSLIVNIGLIKWIAILVYWIWLDYRNIKAQRGHDKLLWGQIVINTVVIALIALEGV